MDYAVDLKKLKVSYVVAPLDGSATTLLNGLLTVPGSRWAYLYYDRENVIMGDTSDPNVAELADKIVRGEANYPDRIPGAGAASRALLLCRLQSFAGPEAGRWRSTPEQRREALEQANREMPSPDAYAQLLQMAGRGELPIASVFRYFSDQFEELGKVEKGPHEELWILRVRMQLARWLAEQAARNAGWPVDRVPLERWLAETDTRDPQKAKETKYWQMRFLELNNQAAESFRKWPM